MRPHSTDNLSPINRHLFLATVIWFGLALAPPVRAAKKGEGPRQQRELNGVVATQEAKRLTLRTDLGTVRVRTGRDDQVSYRVDVETDSQGPDADHFLQQFTVSSGSDAEGVYITGHAPSRHRGGRLWVNFQVDVPKRYNLTISTGGGGINVPDIDGQIILETSGGNITTGRAGGRAHLNTAGGHIVVQDIAGDLTAETGGGHITAANVQGNASLRTGGGHIRAGFVKGTAHLETGGGNVLLDRVEGQVIASTGGGQIELGEASGGLRASTGGGGIRVLRVAGPSELETGGGSIFLTQIGNAVRASTGAGGITAWFAPKATFESASRLECGQGDIVVYLPRELPITIEASIEEGGGNTIVVDPAFKLKLTYGDEREGSHIVRAEGAINGGGKLLHLKTEAGNIRVLLSDAAQQLFREQFEQLQRRLQMERQRMERQMQDLQKREKPEQP